MRTDVFEATEPDWVRAAIAKYRSWIESMLGVSIDATVLLKVDNSLTSIPIRHLMPDVPLADQVQGPTDELYASVASVEFPGEMPPIFAVTPVLTHLSGRSQAPQRSASGCEWEVGWGDTPIAIHFEGMSRAVIVMEIPYSETGTSQVCSLVICRQDAVAQVLALVRKSNVRHEGALFSTGRGFRKANTASWDDLVLDDSAQRLIRNDYESFFSREAWFRAHRLPFRRGYLLHGPPGNGKTSVIRAMLSRPGMCGFTMNFFGTHRDDSDLERMFEKAAENAPSIVVLEDIDRAFPKNQVSGAKCHVSLQQLLNCLDGIGTQDGVIVTATANEPTALDSAILNRPGRFDRVVLFPNPNATLRLKYLCKMNSHLQENLLHEAANLSDGFSFAQMREVYILAGQLAYEQNTDIMPDHISRAARTLRKSFNTARRNAEPVGFASSKTGLEEYDEFDCVQEALSRYSGGTKG